jgi:LAO/AO transport system kinase
VGGLPGNSRLDALADRVAAGDLDPFAAADELVATAAAASG